MNNLDSTKGVATFTLIVYWGCILLGLGIPWLSTLTVDLLKHDQTLVAAIHQLRLHLFAPGYNLFLIAVLNAIPFVLLAVFALFHLGLAPINDRKPVRRRGAGVITASVGLIGFSFWIHVMTPWYPDAQGAIVYLFLPFVLVILTPVVYVIGRILGRLFFP